MQNMTEIFLKILKNAVIPITFKIWSKYLNMLLYGFITFAYTPLIENF